MSFVAGIDASSKAVDIVLLNEDTDEGYWDHCPLVGDTAFDRSRSVRAVFPVRSWWDEVYLVGIEATYSMSFRTATALSLVRGAVGACLPIGLPAIETPANEWQRIFLGLATDEPLTRDRKSRKAAIKRRCIELGFGDAPDLPQDCYDAYGVAWAVRDINRAAVGKAAA